MGVVSTTNAEHYTWPSAINSQICDAWQLHRSDGLSVIEESMPPNTAASRHLHQRSTQLFYLLSGELTIELDGEEHRLPLHTGLTVPAKIPHQVFNRSHQEARFLVISQPPSHGDLVAAESSGS
jgi:mannose-6-phosphate isomerase-like protein (cupin superfamily)